MSQTSSIQGSSSAGGSLSTASLSTTDDQRFLGLSSGVWFQIGVIAGLFSLLFWPNLRRLWDKTNPFTGEANWGHAICIPFIGLYYLYVHREKLLNPDPRRQAPDSIVGLRVLAMVLFTLAWPVALISREAARYFHPALIVVAVIGAAAAILCLFCPDHELVQSADEHSAGWFGVSTLLLGIATFQYAIYPLQNDFFKDFGMVVTLMGIVLALTGWGVIKIAWFPVAFLVCGIPWPGLVYSRVASPLQALAANVAVWTLQITGVEASAGGTKITIIGYHNVQRTLNVAEACAGLRSLMTFISVGAAVAFLSSRPFWQKIIIVLSAIPIAIFCNVMRVSGQGLLDHYVSQQLSENFAHQFVGLIMLIPAFLLILLVGWTLDQIFLEQVDRRHVVTAPKVITRSMTSVPPAVLPTRSAPRSLAAAKAEAQQAAKKKTQASVQPLTGAAKPAGVAKPPVNRPAAPSAGSIKPAPKTNPPASPPRREVI